MLFRKFSHLWRGECTDTDYEYFCLFTGNCIEETKPLTFIIFVEWCLRKLNCVTAI